MLTEEPSIEEIIEIRVQETLEEIREEIREESHEEGREEAKSCNLLYKIRSRTFGYEVFRDLHACSEIIKVLEGQSK